MSVRRGDGRAEVLSDEAVNALHADAVAGDPRAARELGRLLCLLPQEELPTRPWDWLAPRWPAEPWLRAVLASWPDDLEAAVLLAGLLTQQVDVLLMMDTARSATLRTAVDARHSEAVELYDRVLRSDAGNATAKAGLTALRTTLDWHEASSLGGPPPVEAAPAPGHSFFCFQSSSYSGSAGTVAFLVVTDPRELRWACDWSLRLLLLDGEDPESLADVEPSITTYSSGVPTMVVQLGTHLGSSADRPVRWEEIALPSLTGDILPIGHPVLVDLDGSERLAFYGSSSYYDF